MKAFIVVKESGEYEIEYSNVAVFSNRESAEKYANDNTTEADRVGRMVKRLRDWSWDYDVEHDTFDTIITDYENIVAIKEIERSKIIDELDELRDVEKDLLRNDNFDQAYENYPIVFIVQEFEIQE